ncbi:hypothetical protein B4N89_35355 [Embleya scabrispora]|uniref:Uncharacterized protein n=1 Tax=Embleya scabrispora TaxID=159449 RepID=A0A1T3NR82_9ACTN|nr:hypothetical protein [Embleya scabrispora]OPC79329.1 hypothetical protein B4N89_35355 [Embleya scabrispora]
MDVSTHAAIAIRVCALLVLPLRRRAHRERGRGRYVTEALGTIRTGGRLAVDERFADGHRIRMTIEAGPGTGGPQ